MDRFTFEKEFVNAVNQAASTAIGIHEHLPELFQLPGQNIRVLVDIFEGDPYSWFVFERFRALFESLDIEVKSNTDTPETGLVAFYQETRYFVGKDDDVSILSIEKDKEQLLICLYYPELEIQLRRDLERNACRFDIENMGLKEDLNMMDMRFVCCSEEDDYEMVENMLLDKNLEFVRAWSGRIFSFQGAEVHIHQDYNGEISCDFMIMNSQGSVIITTDHPVISLEEGRKIVEQSDIWHLVNWLYKRSFHI